MALLQISEPGQTPAPHQHKLAVGIDLGTTNSLVATVRSGLATVLQDAVSYTHLDVYKRQLLDTQADSQVAEAFASKKPKSKPFK